MPPSSPVRLLTEVGERNLVLETGALAKQAGGAVSIQLGDTVLLATVTYAKTPRGGFPDFVPLTVDYRERTYAAGRIPGGWFKREGRPREKEILGCRLIDRSLRPLFPEGYNIETQLVAIVLSSDQQHDSDVLGINAASAALMISEIPFEGPVGAVRVGYLNEKFILFPTFDEREHLDLELVVSGRKEGILMVEGGGREVSEDLLIRALEYAQKAIAKICALQTTLREKTGKPKLVVPPFPLPEGLKEAVREAGLQNLRKLLRSFPDKSVRDKGVQELKAQIAQGLAEKFPGSDSLVSYLMDELLYEESRRLVLEEKIRADGRKWNEIRPISIQAPILPRTHGSALFTRGQTQALVTTTLGTPQDMQIFDDLEGEFKERFLFHYNFPGFSTGEVKPERGPGRREVGHGALAKRAIYPLLPPDTDFAYTIRIVSDILESNGSSSMASVCGGSLSLFDAGVPLKASCAGIAMGLIWEKGQYAILSDIMGLEDHLGDMDFKVAGTSTGITAFQMDMKIQGMSLDIMKEALAQAKEGRLFILDKMDQAMKAPRTQLSSYAPRLIKVMVPMEKIGALIGPGGKNIRRIIEETGAEIEVEDDGSVFISGVEAEKVEAAKKEVEAITAEAEVGKIYKGKVVSITDFGAFVEILPGKEGLCHISQLADHRVDRVEDVLKQGEEYEFKVLEVDNNGKIRLSRKAVTHPGSESVGAPPTGRSSRPHHERDRSRSR
ncbi:MAG: polyribonucleotide nucleotidyltransferase [Elusimicrobia bacterium]|nr:polyribonucleotide nucleotidyltransferase [Elusimicrobiota bacterium]